MLLFFRRIRGGGMSISNFQWQKYVVENGMNVGFAYDGDADRCLCVDEKGNVITGDHMCRLR